jgi:predicted MFS family arabinose efflux permease
MSIAVLYESGFVGAGLLVLGFLMLLGSLWMAARRFAEQHDTRGVGAAAAFIAAIVTALVAYQATDAYQFALNWIIIGAASALVVASRTPRVSSAAED